jgi:ABC-type sugar transport system substrate-binding protein
MAIKSGGAYQATVTQSPRQMGIFTVRTLVAAIKGLPYEQVYHMQHLPVTFSEVDRFLNKDYQTMEVETAVEEALTKLDLSGIKIGLSILNMTNPFL